MFAQMIQTVSIGLALLGLCFSDSASAKIISKEFGVSSVSPEQVLYTSKLHPMFKFKNDAIAYTSAVLAQDDVTAKRLVEDGIAKGWVRMTIPGRKCLLSELHFTKPRTFMKIHYVGDTEYWFLDGNQFTP